MFEPLDVESIITVYFSPCLFDTENPLVKKNINKLFKWYEERIEEKNLKNMSLTQVNGLNMMILKFKHILPIDSEEEDDDNYIQNEIILDVESIIDPDEDGNYPLKIFNEYFLVYPSSYSIFIDGREICWK